MKHKQFNTFNNLAFYFDSLCSGFFDSLVNLGVL